ncbi:MAG: zinc ribbon domain-containing protein [candidate division WS1 bacterium]|nr:zinc ribbon domain-containing protein [candidate division WS1 bacterium]
MPGGKFCPKCGYSNPAERGACLMCYARLDQTGGGRQCPQCSAEVSEKSRYCSNCGTSLEEGQEAVPGPVALANLLLEAAGASVGAGAFASEPAVESGFAEPSVLSESAFVGPEYAAPAISDAATVADSDMPITGSGTIPGSAPVPDSAIVSDYEDSHFEVAEEAFGTSPGEPGYDMAAAGPTVYDSTGPATDSGGLPEVAQTQYDSALPADSSFEPEVVEEEMFVPPPPGVVTPEEASTEIAPPPPPPMEEELPPPPPPPVDEELAPPPPPPAEAEAPEDLASADFGWELDLPEDKEKPG